MEIAEIKVEPSTDSSRIPLIEYSMAEECSSSGPWHDMTQKIDFELTPILVIIKVSKRLAPCTGSGVDLIAYFIVSFQVFISGINRRFTYRLLLYSPTTSTSTSNIWLQF